jgi:hypothetical protein
MDVGPQRWIGTMVMPPSLALAVVAQSPDLLALSSFSRGHGCGSGRGRCVDLPHWEMAIGVGTADST